MTAADVEIHHIAHPDRDEFCCGEPIPDNLHEVRARGEVQVCAECNAVFKALRRAGTARAIQSGPYPE